MSVFLAYDGSINGDWISRYAIRMAAHAPDAALTVLHVEDAQVSGELLADKLANMEAIAAATSVTLKSEICPMHEGVFGGLLERLPEGPDTVVICGVRVRSRRQGFLGNTISQRLLGHQHFQTVALRVVQPGNLGIARRLLLPVAGHPRGVEAGIALVKLLGADVRICRLLHVVDIGAKRFRQPTVPDQDALRRRGAETLHAYEQTFRDAIGDSPLYIDAAVRVSSDWAQEIIVDAGTFKSDLITLEAPAESLRRGFLHGDPLERILRDTPCDVAIHRGPR